MRSAGTSSTAIDVGVRRRASRAASIICARQPGSCQHQHVRQQQRERLVADDVARAPDRMAEAERRLLAGEARRRRRRAGRAPGSPARRFLPRAASVASSSNWRSKWSSITPLLRPVTKMKCSMPASAPRRRHTGSAAGRRLVSISFGIALVAGRKRVPRPATGKTALRMGFMAGSDATVRAKTGRDRRCSAQLGKNMAGPGSPCYNGCRARAPVRPICRVACQSAALSRLKPCLGPYGRAWRTVCISDSKGMR